MVSIGVRGCGRYGCGTVVGGVVVGLWLWVAMQLFSVVDQCLHASKIVCMAGRGLESGSRVFGLRPVPVPVDTPTRNPHGLPLPVLKPNHMLGLE